ncbi:HTH_Tnp_Tc3_2 domain-containing protein [Trichonephila clavipes]|nr:HTH_Tnp_Tc3_2 domain-containing protein [Trichonephila clavipes]
MKWRIAIRLEVSQSQFQISREFNLTSPVVFNLWKQFQDTKSVKKKVGKGHPRAVTARKDRHLFIITRRYRDTTASQLSRVLSSHMNPSSKCDCFQKTSRETDIYKKTRCLSLDQFCEQESPFKMVQRNRGWSLDQ